MRPEFCIVCGQPSDTELAGKEYCRKHAFVSLSARNNERKRLQIAASGDAR